MTDKTKYPECEKMAAVRDKSQACGEFLEWLNAEKDLHLGSYTSEGLMRGVNFKTEELLAKFFEIDLVKVEAERRAMIEELQG